MPANSSKNIIAILSFSLLVLWNRTRHTTVRSTTNIRSMKWISILPLQFPRAKTFLSATGLCENGSKRKRFLTGSACPHSYFSGSHPRNIEASNNDISAWSRSLTKVSAPFLVAWSDSA